MTLVNDANKFYLGSQLVDKIYLGTTTVWSSVSNLERLESGFVKINSLPGYSVSLTRNEDGSVTIGNV